MKFIFKISESESKSFSNSGFESSSWSDDSYFVWWSISFGYNRFGSWSFNGIGIFSASWSTGI